MKKQYRLYLSVLIIIAMLTTLVMPAMAGEVTVEPEINDITLSYGEVFNETITVTVPAGAAISKADVYLLADTTGSMGGPISAVRTGASEIVDGLIAELSDIDLKFGVGDFKDFPYDAYAFKHSVSITNDTAAVKAAIDNWYASGGGDGPEGQFYAYDQLAENTGGSIGWRPDAKKILVVFGDAPAHDPICSAISGLSYDITEASVTAKLVDAGITFIGISTLTGYSSGMDDNPTLGGGDYAWVGCPEKGTPGQATRIADATGGVHMIGVSSANIVNTIKNLVTTAVTTINNLSLLPYGDITPFVTAIVPASYGPLDSDTEYVLTFDVTFNGVEEAADVDQVFNGKLNVVADGAVVALKTVKITVPGGPPAIIKCEKNLIAAQNINVGTVTVVKDGANLCVTYTLADWAITEGYKLMETHLAIANSLSDIPQTKGRIANPIPGQFPYAMNHGMGVTSFSYCFDLNEVNFSADELLNIAAHAVVKGENFNETAWGQGKRFNQQGNWAMYFTCDLTP